MLAPPLTEIDFDYFEALFTKTKQNSVLLMDTEGTITRVNDHFLESFGYTKNDIVGKNNSMLFTAEDKANGLPERELAAVKNNEQAFDNNYLVSKDGTVTWVAGESVLVNLNNHEIGILKIVQNIHEQKVAESAIRIFYPVAKKINHHLH